MPDQSLTNQPHCHSPCARTHTIQIQAPSQIRHTTVRTLIVSYTDSIIKYHTRKTLHHCTNTQAPHAPYKSSFASAFSSILRIVLFFAQRRAVLPSWHTSHEKGQKRLVSNNSIIRALLPPDCPSLALNTITRSFCSKSHKARLTMCPVSVPLDITTVSCHKSRAHARTTPRNTNAPQHPLCPPLPPLTPFCNR